MRILQVCPISYPIYGASGSAKVAYDFSKVLSDRRHQILLYATDRSSGEVFFPSDEISNCNGVRVFHARRMFGSVLDRHRIYVTSLKSTFFLRAAIKNSDIIHLHEYTTLQNIVAYKFARKYGVPYVLQAHGSIPRIIEKRKLKWFFDISFGYRLLRNASMVIALSNVEADQYRAIGVPNEKIVIIPNGINLSEYSDLPPKGVFKKKLGINEDKKIILYLGRISKIKGIDFLVKAYDHLLKNMKYKDATLVIIGPDSGYLGELLLLIKALKLENNVLVLDPLYGKDKLEAYVDADVYVLPSRYETFPMSVLEALACKTPVILSKNCGAAEYFKETTGIVVKCDTNPNHLCEALLKILPFSDQKSVLRPNCMVKANEFDISRVVSKLQKVYEEIKNGHIGKCS